MRAPDRSSSKLQPPPEARLYFVLGVDIATGRVDNLGIDGGGSGGDFQLSPSGRWAIVLRPGEGGAGPQQLAVSVDGVEVPIPILGRAPGCVHRRPHVLRRRKPAAGSHRRRRFVPLAADLAMAGAWAIVGMAAGDLLVTFHGDVTREQWTEWQLLGSGSAV